jgi:hypothetical protein
VEVEKDSSKIGPPAHKQIVVCMLELDRLKVVSLDRLKVVS